MKKVGKGARKPGQDPLEKIKRLVVIAMFSDDELMDQLVLKGGNALDLVHRITTRASVDVDLSMGQDFPGGAEALKGRVENALRVTFRDAGFAVFDVNMTEKPEQLSPDVADFWGGYKFEFKLIEQDKYDRISGDLEALRRHALKIGSGQKFLIDISKFEYVEPKQPVRFDGYRIFVYTPEMMVSEKLRAICQQMPEYGPVVKRSRRGTPRPRDFVDIYGLITRTDIDMFSPESRLILEAIFEAKKVPLTLLSKVEEHRAFHAEGFGSVVATVRPSEKLESFDVYFDFVLGLIRGLEPLGNE